MYLNNIHFEILNLYVEIILFVKHARMVLRKTGQNEIWLNSYLSYILMRTISPCDYIRIFVKYKGVILIER